jgi:hypothetical protein
VIEEDLVLHVHPIEGEIGRSAARSELAPDLVGIRGFGLELRGEAEQTERFVDVREAEAARVGGVDGDRLENPVGERCLGAPDPVVVLERRAGIAGSRPQLPSS